jgi:hypothetical protein
MTESRDQRFFDGLNNATRAEEPEAPSGATTGPQPIEPASGAWPPPPSNAPEGFAVQEDSAGGKHHVDPPVDGADVAPEQRIDSSRAPGKRAQSRRRGGSRGRHGPSVRPTLTTRTFPRSFPIAPQAAAGGAAQPPARHGGPSRWPELAGAAPTMRRHNHPRALRALPARPDRILRCHLRNALSSFPGRRCGMCCRPTRPRHHRRHGDKLPSAGTDLGTRGRAAASDRVRRRQGGPLLARSDRSLRPTPSPAAAHAHRRGTGDRRRVAEPAALNYGVSRSRLLN